FDSTWDQLHVPRRLHDRGAGRVATEIRRLAWQTEKGGERPRLPGEGTMRTRFLVSAAVAVLLGVVVLLGVAGPAGAQRPQAVDQTPSWPSRYRGSTVVPGQVGSVDQGRGTATVKTPSGEVTTDLGASTVPVTPGDRVDLQLVPTGRSSSVGGTAA